MELANEQGLRTLLTIIIIFIIIIIIIIINIIIEQNFPVIF